jgi:putative transposase
MLSDKQLSLDEHKSFEWLKEVPYDTRQLTLKQLASNFKTNFTLLKRKHIKFFEMKFKSRKNPYQMCFVDKNAFNLQSLRLFPRRLKEQLKVRKRLIRWIEKNKCESDFVIKREKSRYFICLPYTKPGDKVKQPYTRVALDPGVRTFQTFYSDQGIAGKIGDSICETLIDIGLKEDKLKSYMSKNKVKKHTLYNMKKRCFLLRSKIKNIVNDLHWKTAHFLCSTFKHILLPSYETSNMVRNSIPERARKIRSCTVRKMLSLSPHAFKEKLFYMGTRMGCKIDIVDEAYTTKTCGMCGTLKEMGGLKIYKCNECGFTLDRDYNGARNIFLKYLYSLSGLDTTR